MKQKNLLIIMVVTALLMVNCKKDPDDPLLLTSGFTYGGITDNDGNSYRTVQIGNTLWMAENLKTTRYLDGTAIPNVTDNDGWSNLSSGAYCWYNNDSSFKATYGALYNFTAALSTKSLCPNGWRVPQDFEWSDLTTFLGDEATAGGKMKEAGTSHWLTPNKGATNSTGFSGLPGGERNNKGVFVNMTRVGFWWSYTMYGFEYSYHRQLQYDHSSAYRDIRFSQNGMSVRCIMQEPEYGYLSDNDGNTYRTVQIGGQTWMAENLKTTKYRDGTSLPNISNDGLWSSLSTGAYSWYGNDVKNKGTYGALYNWLAVVDSRHLCPAGWHVPGDAEWSTLINLFGESVAGGKLKEKGTAHWISPNTGADNFSGFNGFPGGGRQGGGTFAFAGSQAFWWSTTAKSEIYAWSRYLSNYEAKASRYSDLKQSGFSVRCIKD